MRTFIAIAAIFAAVNADAHTGMEDETMGLMSHASMDHGDWDKDHHMGHDDWTDMDCMMTGMGCDSAISLSASAAALVAAFAVAM